MSRRALQAQPGRPPAPPGRAQGVRAGGRQRGGGPPRAVPPPGPAARQSSGADAAAENGCSAEPAESCHGGGGTGGRQGSGAALPAGRGPLPGSPGAGGAGGGRRLRGAAGPERRRRRGGTPAAGAEPPRRGLTCGAAWGGGDTRPGSPPRSRPAPRGAGTARAGSPRPVPAKAEGRGGSEPGGGAAEGRAGHPPGGAPQPLPQRPVKNKKKNKIRIKFKIIIKIIKMKTNLKNQINKTRRGDTALRGRGSATAPAPRRSRNENSTPRPRDVSPPPARHGGDPPAPARGTGAGTRGWAAGGCAASPPRSRRFAPRRCSAVLAAGRGGVRRGAEKPPRPPSPVSSPCTGVTRVRASPRLPAPPAHTWSRVAARRSGAEQGDHPVPPSLLAHGPAGSRPSRRRLPFPAGRSAAGGTDRGLLRDPRCRGRAVSGGPAALWDRRGLPRCRRCPRKTALLPLLPHRAVGRPGRDPRGGKGHREWGVPGVGCPGVREGGGVVARWAGRHWWRPVGGHPWEWGGVSSVPSAPGGSRPHEVGGCVCGGGARAGPFHS